MKAKTKRILIAIMIISYIATGAGFYLLGSYTKKDVVIIEKKSEVKEKPRPKKDIAKYTPTQTEAELLKWENSPARLDGWMINENTLRARAGLNDREWERDFTFKAKAKNNNEIRDKLLLFFGGMVIGGMIGGAADHEIIRPIEGAIR